MSEIACETRGVLPVSMVFEEGPQGRRIVAAKIGDGTLNTLTHELLSPESNLRFMAWAIGARRVGGRPIGLAATSETEVGGVRSATVGAPILVKLGATGLATAINQCFLNGRFEVNQPMTVAPPLADAQKELLQLFAQGRDLPSIISETSDRNGTIAQRDGLFAAFGVQTIFAAITVGYLTGELPSTPS